jgi:hypothetical protein
MHDRKMLIWIIFIAYIPPHGVTKCRTFVFRICHSVCFCCCCGAAADDEEASPSDIIPILGDENNYALFKAFIASCEACEDAASPGR